MSIEKARLVFDTESGSVFAQTPTDNVPMPSLADLTDAVEAAAASASAASVSASAAAGSATDAATVAVAQAEKLLDTVTEASPVSEIVVDAGSLDYGVLRLDVAVTAGGASSITFNISADGSTWLGSNLSWLTGSALYGEGRFIGADVGRGLMSLGGTASQTLATSTAGVVNRSFGCPGGLRYIRINYVGGTGLVGTVKLYGTPAGE